MSNGKEMGAVPLGDLKSLENLFGEMVQKDNGQARQGYRKALGRV
jgi:hypothetical protein